jgi:hypothetical protein
MRELIEQFNDLAPLSPFRSWLDCTINTSGCDFRKGQAVGGSLTSAVDRIRDDVRRISGLASNDPEQT